ncbi:MAG: hypothetical protein ACPHCI_05275 [Solirubrobacterales bacterium]
MHRNTQSSPNIGRGLSIGTALTIFVAIVAVAFTASATRAPSAAALTVGVGDNGPGMFNDPYFQRLETKISRKILPYDFYKYQWDRDNLDQWMAGAKSRGIQPLIAFNHSNVSPRRLPSVGQFKYALRYLLRKYPQVRTVSPWNEANHHTQPTAKRPKRAAQYYNAARKICRRCKIVAADVLDQKNMIPWIKKFRRYANRPYLWGLHSYRDTNKRVSWRRSATRKLLKNVRGKVWLTEVGGLVAFGHRYRYSERRAKTATRRTLSLAKKSRRIQRVYFYAWHGTDHARMRRPYLWDSGLMGADGKPRPAYYVLSKWIRKYQ